MPPGQMSTAQPSELVCLPQEPQSHNEAQDLLLLQVYVYRLTHPQATTSKVTMWRHGEVPPLGPAAEGRARAAKQLAYARTLLAAVMEAATQMEEVVGNLEQIENEQASAKEEEPGQADPAAPTEPRIEPATEGSQN